MTLEDWEVAVSPKVKGTLNLHEVFKSERLDFFVLLSSLNGIFGSSGQANYAAGNTFLDAFVQFRRRQGLPASVIDVGVIDDIGYVSRNLSVLEYFRSISAYTIGERLLLDAVQLAITRSKSLLITEDSFINPSQIAIGLGSTLPLTNPNSHFPWRREARLSLYRNIENDTVSSQGPSSEKLQQFLSAIVAEPSRLYEDSSVSLLTQEIGLQLFHYLLRPKEDLDVKMSLPSIGIDSLLSIELRNWWRRTLNLEISVLEILNVGSIEDLGKVALQGLREKYGHVGQENLCFG
jgi:KR domain/Phosphopantetheine attachment site